MSIVTDNEVAPVVISRRFATALVLEAVNEIRCRLDDALVDLERATLDLGALAELLDDPADAAA